MTPATRSMEMARVASNFNHESPASDFGFLLIPKFSMLALSGVLEPLRMANRLAGRELYRWRLLSMDDTPVPASNDLKFAPTARLDEAHRSEEPTSELKSHMSIPFA